MFATLNLSARLLKTLAAEGYETPTPIQVEAIPPVLAGHDLLGCAQTGTGKTAAFLLPLIDRLSSGGRRSRDDRGPRLPRALILAPTRELAAQIEDSMRTYGRSTGLRHAVIYGGVSQFRQVRQLQAGVDVIVATPGRLLDLMEQGHVDLSGIEVFALDEADRMFDMGFIEPIRQITGATPDDRQTLLFSATMPPKIRQLSEKMLRDPVCVSVTPVSSVVPQIDQSLYHVPAAQKPALLTHLLRDAQIVRTVVFTKTKHGAEKLAKLLSRHGVTARAIHGNKSQSQRERALDSFRTGRARVLVATDVAARGLDVDGVTHVFNYNLPNEPEAYVHRIGRTGRAGATGRAISFCSREERGFLRAIERLTGRRIESASVPDDLAPLQAPPASDAPRDERQADQRREKPTTRRDKPARRDRRQNETNAAPKRRRGKPGNHAKKKPNAPKSLVTKGRGKKQRRPARTASA